MLASGTDQNDRPSWFDRLLIAVLAFYGACVLLFLAVEPLYFMPAEDAVILWAYSRNLALHGAITYFAGGPHTEGATDFAWMVAVAGAIRCGVDPQVFTAVINVLCLFVLACLLVRMTGLRPTVLRLLAVAGAAGCTPQIFAAASGFATLPDAVLLTALVFATMQRNLGSASAIALVFCLFRPDALVFALPLLVGGFLLSTNRERADPLLFAVFLVPGAAYFFWRWHYFQQLLPLPFYVKADAHRVLHTLVSASVRTSIVYLAFTLLLTWLASKFRRQPLQGRHLLLPLIVIPTLFYWCIRLDQNVGFRFFFYLPLAGAILLALNWHALGSRSGLVLRLGCLGWLVLLAMPLRRELRTFLDLQSPDLRAIAKELSHVPHQGFLLSSEAGILPYDSGWPAVDPWGLNTVEYAHRFFQPGDVKRLAPALIHLHPDVGESCVIQRDWQAPYLRRGWSALTRNLVAGADPAEYDLWQTSYGSEHYRQRKHWSDGEGDKACWFIRKGTSEHDAIAGVLERHHGIAIQRSTP